MSRYSLNLLAICALALTGCQTIYEDTALQAAGATLLNRSGTDIGSARVFTLNEEVTINVALEGADAGTYSAHLSGKGACSFEPALPGPVGPILADLPSFQVSPERRGVMSALLEDVASTLLPSLVDGDGATLVLYAPHPGDRETEPARPVACGVFRSP